MTENFRREAPRAGSFKTSFAPRKTTTFICVGLLVSTLMGLCVMGCATQNRLTHLRDTLRSFNQQVRWGLWPGAARHVDQKMRRDWLESRLAAAQGLKMTDVRLVNVSSDGPRSREAKAVVTLTWYRTADMKVYQSHWLQTWEHTRNGWRLMKEDRQLKESVPIKKKPKADWP